MVGVYRLIFASEHTLAVTEDGVRALTAGPDGGGWGL
jgi:methionine aminopeptidase